MQDGNVMNNTRVALQFLYQEVKQLKEEDKRRIQKDCLKKKMKNIENKLWWTTKQITIPGTNKIVKLMGKPIDASEGGGDMPQNIAVPIISRAIFGKPYFSLGRPGTHVEDSMNLLNYANENDRLGGEVFGDELMDMYITPEDIIGEASSSSTLPCEASSNPAKDRDWHERSIDTSKSSVYD